LSRVRISADLAPVVRQFAADFAAVTGQWVADGWHGADEVEQWRVEIRKNPQAQAIRTRSRELQFSGLEADRAKQRGTLCDYLIKFRAKGDNETPIQSDGEVSRNDWISWAEGCWTDIRETDTLNVKEGRGEDDTKHICPLQLSVIDRIIRLYSNPGELVFSPFTGIGSEGYTALKLGRRFYGCELKDEYYEAALKNCQRALERQRSSDQLGLFGDMDSDEVPV